MPAAALLAELRELVKAAVLRSPGQKVQDRITAAADMLHLPRSRVKQWVYGEVRRVEAWEDRTIRRYAARRRRRAAPPAAALAEPSERGIDPTSEHLGDVVERTAVVGPQEISAAAGGVILIPKPLRAEWMDALALDPKLTARAHKVAGVIGFHFNHASGETYIKQETIARLMGLSERTVWAAIGELEQRGYMIIKRRDLGVAVRRGRSGTSTTVRNAGGKGVANTYTPAFQRSQITATNMGRKLAEYCDHYVAQWSQKRVAKVAADCEPTLKSNPLRTRARVEHQLGEAGDALCENLGAAVFKAWFGKARCEAVEGDVLKLSVPSEFEKRRLAEHYQEVIIACWQKMHSSGITRVEVTVRSQ